MATNPLIEGFETGVVKTIISLGIRRYMTKHKLSYRNIGEAVGVDHTTIWNYAQGFREPSLTTFLRLTKMGVVFNFDWI